MKRLARATQASPTRVVVSTSVPDGGGNKYAPLENESIEQVVSWYDYNAGDDDALFAEGDRAVERADLDKAAAAAATATTTLEKAASVKLRARDVNVPSAAASGLEGGPAAKRARVADASNAAELPDAPEPTFESARATVTRRERLFSPMVFGETKVLRFGPLTDAGEWFDVYLENESQPRRVRGDVEAKLELRPTSVAPRFEHASYNARTSGKHEVRSVGVRNNSDLKILGKTFAWTSRENVGHAAQDDCNVLIAANEDAAIELANERKRVFARKFAQTIVDAEDVGLQEECVEKFAGCFRMREGRGCTSFSMRSFFEKQCKAARLEFPVTFRQWSAIKKEAKTTIVYDKYAYATRPNPVNGPTVLTSGREAVEFAKRWIDERRREVSEYLNANVNTLREVYFALARSPGPGDRPKGGYWIAPTHERRARAFVEEAGDDATTKVDKNMKNDGLNSYSARATAIFRKDSISNSCTKVATLADVRPGDLIATNVDGESGRPTRFKKVASVAKHAAREIVQVSLKSVPEYVAFTCSTSTTLVNAAPARFILRVSDAVDTSRRSVTEIAFVADEQQRGALRPESLTLTVYPEACESVEQARARAFAKADELRQPGARIETKVSRSGVVKVTRDGEDVATFSATAAMHSPNIVSDMAQVPEVLAKRKNIVTRVTSEAAETARFEDKSEEEFQKMMALHNDATGEDRDFVTLNKRKERGAFYLGCAPLFALPSCAMGVLRDGDDDDEDVIDDADFYWAGFWLGDGAANCTSFTIADTERDTIEEALRAYADSIEAEVGDFRAAADGGACGTIYMYQPNHFCDVLRRLNLLGTKRVSARAIRFLLKQTRAARLAFLAGLVDSDGCVSQFDKAIKPTHIGLGQSLVNTATTHGTILAAFGVVAQSLGCDVRYVEQFHLARQVARDENGRVIRKGDANYPTREEQREATDFRRYLTAKVLIAGPAAMQIPTKTDKKLDESVPFDDATGFDDATHAIRAASLGLYELRVRTLDEPIEMISLTFEDPQNDDAVALATGFRVLTCPPAPQPSPVQEGLHASLPSSLRR